MILAWDPIMYDTGMLINTLLLPGLGIVNLRLDLGQLDFEFTFAQLSAYLQAIAVFLPLHFFLSAHSCCFAL